MNGFSSGDSSPLNRRVCSLEGIRGSQSWGWSRLLFLFCNSFKSSFYSKLKRRAGRMISIKPTFKESEKWAMWKEQGKKVLTLLMLYKNLTFWVIWSFHFCLHSTYSSQKNFEKWWKAQKGSKNDHDFNISSFFLVPNMEWKSPFLHFLKGKLFPTCFICTCFLNNNSLIFFYKQFIHWSQWLYEVGIYYCPYFKDEESEA